MAKLPPNLIRAMRNLQLRMDVEDLQSAYRASLIGLVHRESEIEDMVRAQLGLGPDDPWPDGNEEDPEDPVSLLYARAGELDAQAKRGAPMVRIAFLIALFHAWERHCNARMKTGKYLTENVNVILRGEGHSAFCDALEHLQLAANCAKHGPGRSCSSLFDKRPDLFPNAKSAEKASETTLSVDEDTLMDFFNTVLSVSR
ncbi:hypothetical protein [Shinella granuli]|nr:hypothetical protein [Shinella granuli]